MAETGPGVGGRPRVLLLHGFLESREAWRGVMRELVTWADPVAPDLLGHGRAPRPRHARDLEAMTAYLRPVVERTRPTHVVGHSMGAVVALALAAEHPAQFEAVGLMGLPMFASRKEGEMFIAQRGRLRHAFVRNDLLAHLFCFGAYRTRWAWTGRTDRAMPSTRRGGLAYGFDHSLSAHRDELGSVIFAGRVPALAARVPARVAVLHGGRDRVVPAAPVYELAAERGWEVRTEAEVNHQANLERPDVVARWVRECVVQEPGPWPEPRARVMDTPGRDEHWL